MKKILVPLFFLLAVRAFPAEGIDWKVFMSRQDLLWTELPQAWDEAPFMGNGSLGTYVCRETGSNAIRIDVGNSYVHDYRTDDLSVYGRGRLLVGHFTLEPVGTITSGEMRLNLWNAQTEGSIHTTEGTIRLKVFVASGNPFIIAEASGEGGESGFRWRFHPARADSPRQLNAQLRKSKSQYKAGYVSNPAPELRDKGALHFCFQPLLAGGSTTTGWREWEDGGRRTLIATCAHTPSSHASLDEAERALRQMPGVSALKEVEKAHKDWWHRYYPSSFVSLPDKRIENFYWIQMYKLASATRADGALIDNCGPWLVPTPWPNAWWNLNVQLTYWPVYASNRLELGLPLVKAVHDNAANLTANVAGPYRYDSSALPVATGFDMLGTQVAVPSGGRKAQIGLLPWVCHNIWLQYRFSMDKEILRGTLYPVLRRAVNYYLHFLTEDAEGVLHLPPTFSPEYGSAPDCNFDLSLLRWGCETLLEADSLLEAGDPLVPEWKRVLKHLAPFPQDETGILIGDGVPYARSHRHYSHLLMFYPLYLLNSEQEGSKELLEKSIARWHGIHGNILGYSLTGAASMYASFGEGDKALEQLRRLFGKYLRPNTMYKEGGPVIETPLSGAQVVHDMLLQSWGNKIRVFPSVPSSWGDVAFDRLRAQGAFLVSALREAGKTVYIRIESLAGEPCILKTDMENMTLVQGNAGMQRLSADEYRISLSAGESAVFVPVGQAVREIGPVEGEGMNFFGIHSR